MQAASTGHLLISTLHTNDAVGAVARLNDLGIDSFKIGGALLGSIAQRLLRSICPHCKEPVEPNKHYFNALAHGAEPPDDVVFYRGRGCKKCLGTGYAGRVPIYEIMVVTPAMAQAIENGLPTTKLREVGDHARAWSNWRPRGSSRCTPAARRSKKCSTRSPANGARDMARRKRFAAAGAGEAAGDAVAAAALAPSAPAAARRSSLAAAARERATAQAARADVHPAEPGDARRQRRAAAQGAGDARPGRLAGAAPRRARRDPPQGGNGHAVQHGDGRVARASATGSPPARFASANGPARWPTRCEHLAENRDKSRELRPQVIKKLAYPGMLVVLGSGLITFLLLYVVPVFEQTYADAQGAAAVRHAGADLRRALGQEILCGSSPAARRLRRCRRSSSCARTTAFAARMDLAHPAGAAGRPAGCATWPCCS